MRRLPTVLIAVMVAAVGCADGTSLPAPAPAGTATTAFRLATTIPPPRTTSTATTPPPASAGPPTSPAPTPTSARPTSSPTASGRPVTASYCTHAPPPDRVEHVIWLMFENHRAAQVVGSPSAPFTTTLAQSCASASDYRQVASPSLPNYLGATSGDTHGVSDDAPPSAHPVDSDNLFRQVRSAGGRAVTYAEAMPSPCALGGGGRYAVKHNPAAYYTGGDDRAACQHDNLPLGSPTSGPFAEDLATGTLATFTFVVPDLCNDTHDCPVATGDTWLRSWMSKIVDSPTYAAGKTIVFVAWDEPTPMPFLVIAPSIQPGTVIRTRVDHWSLLRTTEELLDMPLLGSAVSAPSMRADIGA